MLTGRRSTYNQKIQSCGALHSKASAPIASGNILTTLYQILSFDVKFDRGSNTGPIEALGLLWASTMEALGLYSPNKLIKLRTLETSLFEECASHSLDSSRI